MIKNKQLLCDLKKYRDVMVFSSKTGCYFGTTKKEVRDEAKSHVIHYEIVNYIFRNNRDVILIY